MAEKKSQFTTVSTVSDNRSFNVFGQNVDEQIGKPDLFNQIRDEIYSPFIYPTVELLQAADLEADEDFPTYVRVEENQCRLYKITSLAAGVNDIELDNGATATYLPVSDSTTVVETFADLAATPVTAGTVYYLKEYHAGIGKGGGHLIGKAGSATYDNVLKFAGTGGYFERINYDDIWVEMAGAYAGKSDNFTEINAAIVAAQYNNSGRQRVRFEYGVYNVSAGFTIYQAPVRLIGAGVGDPGSPNLVTTGTSISYTGASDSAPILWMKEIWFGSHGCEHITFLCNNNKNGISVDSCAGGTWTDIHIREDNNCGFDVRADQTQTCSFNTFTNIVVDDFYATGGVAGVRCTGGGAGGYNACHNVFINLRVNHNNSRHALILADCDNIVFIQSYLYKAGGTGYGVYCDGSVHGGFPGNNTFWHLQAIGGYYQNASCTFPGAVIYGYQQDNGEPDPVNAGSTTATPMYITDNFKINGIRSMVYRPNSDNVDKGNSVITTGNTFVDISVSSPNGNYSVFIMPAQNPGSYWWVNNRTTTGFRVNLSVAAGGNWNFDWFIQRTA